MQAQIHREQLLSLWEMPMAVPFPNEGQGSSGELGASTQTYFEHLLLLKTMLARFIFET